MKFRMVDQILAWEPGQSIRGTKAVSFEEYCAPLPLGSRAELPASLALESLLQLGNWLVMLSTDCAQVGLVTALERVEFTSALRPGQSMATELSVREKDETAWLLSGCGTIRGREMLRVEGMRLQLRPLASYCRAADLRVLFSEICRPAAEVKL
ncbi:MAG: hypothetical protein ACHRHE_08390 [Tepidisphaerales bacterium]